RDWSSDVCSSDLASARSAIESESRAVMTALCPAFRTSSASARPSPVEHPVISQVAIMAPFLSVGSYWIIHGEQPGELSDMLRIELVNTACTQQSHCAQNFRLYDLDHLVHTGTPTGHQTV